MRLRPALLVLSALPSSLRAQGADWIRANYTKNEFEIPMRDGVRLFAAVYTPKDSTKSYPILLRRTPY
ncbi:MAG TPA: X-Pro dipeptidyl-peptidase, partial [Planctomycetota bacterium]|nr:X-Pro dipeptidyl-peptidase [Planctomycetota bacterium]